jgi:YbbR domain-containing protein
MRFPLATFPRLRRWFQGRDNLWLKVVSLVFALVVWLWASNWVYNRVTRTARVTVKLAPQMTLKSVNPPSVEVILETPGQLMSLGAASDETPLVACDLTDKREPGTFPVALGEGDVRLPFRASVVSVNPDRAVVEIDRLSDKVLPVKVLYRGDPHPGYRISGAVVVPPEVLIPGPDSVLNNMTVIETEPINVAGRRESFPEDALLKPVSPDPEIQPRPVRVRVEIEPIPEKRRISSIPVVLLREPRQSDEVTIVPAEIAVVLRGQKVPLESVMPRDIRAYVDLSGLAPGLYQLPVQTRIPASVALDAADPAVVKVTVGQTVPALPPEGK